ncbi:ankyrin repeat domain-containing protein [Rickettsia sp. TH2014]|uniref:ankyrin repeat domain-containing protein n=1 Tax=Rickettsia sp. TH2014 TaxID=1967503 RepID=UPI0021143779|nr:ankyrin repeat domain-containing protein [Rickettsia sp. TH2014]
MLTAFSIAPNEVVYILNDSGCLLYFVCKNNQKEIAELLIKKGADVNFSDNIIARLYIVL